MSSYHTTPLPCRWGQSSAQAAPSGTETQHRPAYPRHARITGWMIRQLTNGERLVAEGLRIELRDGESRITTSAEIAQWANVSESTVSRAMPGLIANRVITARRVVYAETGRDRWEITLLPIREDRRASTGPIHAREHDGSVMDADNSPPQGAHEASHCPVSTVRDTSMTDPSNLLDSESHMQQHAAHACLTSGLSAEDDHDDVESSADLTSVPAPPVTSCAETYTEPYQDRTTTPAPGVPGTVPTPLSGVLSQIAFSGALAKIQRLSPGYSAVRFAADLDKALTRFGDAERDRAVALVIWCAMRQEPVYSREDLQTRAQRICPPASGETDLRLSAAARSARRERTSDLAHGAWDAQGVGVTLPESLRRAYDTRLRAQTPEAESSVDLDSGMGHAQSDAPGSTSSAACLPVHQHPPAPAGSAWTSPGVGSVLPDALRRSYMQRLRAHTQAAEELGDQGLQGGTA